MHFPDDTTTLPAADVDTLDPRVDDTPPVGRGSRGQWQLWLGALVSAVMLVGVVRWALAQDPPRLPDAGSGYLILGATVVGYLLNMVLRGFRWDLILRAAGLRHRLADSVGLTFVGYGANAILPARGGDLLRAALVRRRMHTGWRAAVGSLVAERVADLAILISLLAVLTLADVGGRPLGTIAPLLAVTAAIAGFVVLALAPRLARLPIVARVMATAAPLLVATRAMISPAGIGIAAVTLLVWLGDSLALMGCARALDVDLAFEESVLVVVIASLSGVIPAAPGNVGTFDAALIFALHACDVSGSDALSVAVLVRFVFFAPVILIAVLLVATRYGWSWRPSAADTTESAPTAAPTGSSSAAGSA